MPLGAAELVFARVLPLLVRGRRGGRVRVGVVRGVLAAQRGGQQVLGHVRELRLHAHRVQRLVPLQRHQLRGVLLEVTLQIQAVEYRGLCWFLD